MMEENTRPDPDRPQDPGPGQESNRALLPLIQPPGNQQSNRITNFYIDNILRPDFGRNWKDDGSVHKEGTVAGRTLREELKEKRACKTGNPLQDGARAESEEDTRASKGQPPDSEDSTSDLGFGDPAEGQGRGGDSAAHVAQPMLWPAWVYCTRYSDRPSSGPRSRKPKKTPTPSKEDKRPRTAFTAEQLHQLDIEFQNNRYLTEQRRQSLARNLGLNESQIKIWFQNKRAKIKKASGNKNALALHLRAQGLYNHSTAKDHKSDSE